jgi:transcriptional regulator with XRE-family HTH domain
MGQRRRPTPKHLANKLLQIRLKLGLGQAEMAKLFKKVPSPPDGSLISRYERGVREPSLLVLLAYAKLANVSTDYLIDDKLRLPK